MFFNNNADSNTNIDSSLNKNQKSGGINLRKIFIIIAAVVILLLIVFLIAKLVNNSNSNSTITLNGGDIKIYKNTRFIDLGYDAKDSSGKDVSSKVKITGTVDSSKTGEYTITYKLGKNTLKRKVTVVDKTKTTTVITIVGDRNINLNLNETYIEPGFKVLDSKYKNLEDAVITYGTVDEKVKGTYHLVYTYVNEEGVTVTDERTVYVK